MASFNVITDFRHRRRRANTLGFAKVDCHTCSALNERCDRRRPQCDSCRLSKRKCGGFAVDLVWKDLAMPDKMTQPAPGALSPRASPQTPREPHEFKFIQGRPRRKRKPRATPTRACAALSHSRHQTPPFVVTTSSDFAGSESAGAVSTSPESIDDKSSPGSCNEPEVFMDIAPCAYNGATEQLWPGRTSSNEPFSELLTMSQCLHDPSLLEYMSPGGTQPAEWAYIAATSETALSTSQILSEDDESYDALEEFTAPIVEIRYRDLAQKYGGVLAMYDEEFCIMPLSSDCNANPFRVTSFPEQHGFLLHAVLAISSQHLAKKNNSLMLAAEMQKHRSMAIQLFSEALCQSSFLSLLNTIVMLVHLEVTQSASGLWGVHLNGARKLLEEAEFLERHVESSRVRAQIAMLIWWDITIAILSRHEPRIPIAYLESLTKYDESDGWNFFTLTGCPIELVLLMARLAKLASIYTKTTKMEWTIFNRHPVDVIVDEVKRFVNKQDVGLDQTETLEEDVDARRNRYHCVEAWRHTILLYICRVFTPEQNAHSIQQMRHLARIIVEHARCIPRADMVQKQLLLPLFLAASELGDDWNRSFVRRYCRYWSSTSRFEHFGDTLTLLERIWIDMDASPRGTSWWGSGIGGEDLPQSDGRGEQPVDIEILLG